MHIYEVQKKNGRKELVTSTLLRNAENSAGSCEALPHWTICHETSLHIELSFNMNYNVGYLLFRWSFVSFAYMHPCVSFSEMPGIVSFYLKRHILLPSAGFFQ